MIETLYTMGGYGYSQDAFFDRLEANGVDALVDIRQRRGMRGRQYSFLNSTALQTELLEREIAYLHLKELSPTTAVRDAQKSQDLSSGVAKRKRDILSCEFVAAYSENVLVSLDPEDIWAKISGYKRPCFFCVEAAERACHRSLVTDWLTNYRHTPVNHIQGR